MGELAVGLRKLQRHGLVPHDGRSSDAQALAARHQLLGGIEDVDQAFVNGRQSAMRRSPVRRASIDCRPVRCAPATTMSSSM
jgi:hypothetical protein